MNLEHPIMMYFLVDQKTTVELGLLLKWIQEFHLALITLTCASPKSYKFIRHTNMEDYNIWNKINIMWFVLFSYYLK